jgi:hypothetical protein
MKLVQMAAVVEQTAVAVCNTFMPHGTSIAISFRWSAQFGG